MHPQVDILLATYQGAEFLNEQLESIYRQSYPEIRVIARDDASRDQTVEILKSHQLKLLDSTKNLGCKQNFSKLLSHSEAPYVCFSDQDDLWLPHKVDECLQAMIKEEKAQPPGTPILVHTDLVVVDQNLQEIAPSFWNYAGLNPHEHSTFNRLLVQNCVTGCSMMINRPLADLAKDIPNESKMHDWWLALVASAFGKIIAVNRPSILYRQHGNNTIGAQKLGVLHLFKRFLKGNLETARLGRKHQAQTFLSRYESKLSEKQRLALKAVIDADDRSWVKNNFEAYRQDIYRTGLLSNCARFFMKNPF
jgi:glycosyltransferase involved in cell wall biosynthesis